MADEAANSAERQISALAALIPLPPSGPRHIVARVWDALRSRLVIDRFDLVFLIALVAGVCAYHHNLRYWAGQVLVGNWQYGDAEFWWNGAIQFAEGIVRDNPNLTFRMGYAVVGGLWAALFGRAFSSFHIFLLSLFIVTWYALYLVLRPSLGKLGAAAGVLLVALNPFTAEWLAISTSDSVGLLFNTWALVFLVAGLRGTVSPLWLSGVGLFAAFSSLTRPLMTPFLGLAALLPLLAVSVNWRRRLQAAGAVLAAFAVPTMLWMGFLRSFTGSWSLAGSEASTFYAASDPQIQVWTSAMYDRVAARAKERFHVDMPSTRQMDDEFWLLTFQNYARFRGYHLRRILPHYIEIADMSIDRTAHVDARSRRLRRWILAALALALSLSLFWRGAWMRGLLVALIMGAWIVSANPATIVLLAAVGVIPLTLWNRSGWSGAILVGYWVTGTAALYLVGGSSVSPSGGSVLLNALGYRLGAQFFFIADLIVLCLIHNLCTLRLRSAAGQHEVRQFGWVKSWISARGRASAAVSAALLICAALVCGQVAAGGVLVARNLIRRSTATAQPFPDLGPVLASATQRIRRFLPSASLGVSTDAAESILMKPEDSPYVLATGATTDFIFALEGQTRTKVLMALQSKRSPPDYARRLFVDFPAPLSETEWARRQGAWLLRRFQDEPLKSTLPAYVSDVAVRAFIPLRDESFEPGAAEWFPVPKYASQLYHAKQLTLETGQIEFSGTSGAERSPRRFKLSLAPETNASPAISIDASKAVGARSLGFSWQYELAPAEFPRKLAMHVQHYPLNGRHDAQPLEIVEEQTAVSSNSLPLKPTAIDLNSPPTGRVRLQFDGLHPGDAVWIYELNVIADDWDW